MRPLTFIAILATAGSMSAYAADMPATNPQPAESLTAPGETPMPAEAAATVNQTIPELAMSDARFSTLAKALTAAGLTETLAAAGPYTVFAPTNDAFAAAGEETVASWMAPENKAVLASTLSYHVVAGRIGSADIPEGVTEVPTLQGGTLKVEKTAEGVFVNGAKVVEADIAASNGTIHAIDKVVIPATGATN